MKNRIRKPKTQGQLRQVKVIKTACGHLSECPPARDKDGAPTTKNVIAAFFHCKKCLEELPFGQSPREWAQLEVGFTEIGLQVYCKRHDINVMHIDFEGQQHPANLRP